MKKFYISNKKNLSKEEERSGNVSYKRIIDAYINNLILCNNITKIDESIWDNFNFFDENLEIFQYYLCNLNEYEKERLTEFGIILSYSNKLDLDVLCVEHYGTPWDSVLTDVEWTENFDLIEVEE